MFKRVQKLHGDVRIDSIIGKSTKLLGKLFTENAIRIDGRIEGDVESKGEVIIGEEGQIAATIVARYVTVAGEVNGDIKAEGWLRILPTGRVYGDVKVGKLTIENGAVFRGSCEMLNDKGAMEQGDKEAAEQGDKGAMEQGAGLYGETETDS